ncbi:MAG: pseudouridine synthase [Bacteroidota bacterium]
MLEYFAIYKPFGMLSQFSKEGNRATLADLGDFNKDVYPVGRLDADSEGLLILTNDKSLNSRLLDPQNGHGRKYLVQVEGSISAQALRELKVGVRFRSKGRVYQSRLAEVRNIDEPSLPERNPPVRFRQNIPTSWIEIGLTEGKNRQVRKMTAAVGFPTLRLVRHSIEKLTIESMLPGDIRKFNKTDLLRLLNL